MPYLLFLICIYFGGGSFLRGVQEPCQLFWHRICISRIMPNLGDKHIGRRIGMKLAWIVCVRVRRSFYKEYSGRKTWLDLPGRKIYFLFFLFFFYFYT